MVHQLRPGRGLTSTVAVDLEARFWAKVDRSGGTDACWLWLRGIGSHGYGQYHPALGVQVLAHRFALSTRAGPSPEGLPHALHSRACISKRCVNPAHLRWGTHTENMSDAGAIGVMHRPRKTTCPSGHKMTAENTLVKKKRWKGSIYETATCRECNRIYLARRRAGRKSTTSGK